MNEKQNKSKIAFIKSNQHLSSTKILKKLKEHDYKKCSKSSINAYKKDLKRRDELDSVISKKRAMLISTKEEEEEQATLNKRIKNAEFKDIKFKIAKEILIDESKGLGTLAKIQGNINKARLSLQLNKLDRRSISYFFNHTLEIRIPNSPKKKGNLLISIALIKKTKELLSLPLKLKSELLCFYFPKQRKYQKFFKIIEGTKPKETFYNIARNDNELREFLKDGNEYHRFFKELKKNLS